MQLKWLDRCWPPLTFFSSRLVFFQIYLLTAPATRFTMGVFRMHMHLLNGPPLAMIFPVVNTRLVSTDAPHKRATISVIRTITGGRQIFLIFRSFLRNDLMKWGSMSVRPSTNFSSDMDETWYVGRGWWVIHDNFTLIEIQCQSEGHCSLKIAKRSKFRSSSDILGWQNAYNHNT